ncbi:hypothetical protein EOT10_03880 [Streptomyces antnestii]|uniref:Uncharacterized protein n=1 Tax=Streptomyces antnestii TaxID=2494256 RepID=A0A437Q3C4_9ACTN|nr:Imm10 family immunity protein [Streptomyces sp. San01]RVU28990.1 hypothetical protein EOT10_03880 [Streptomyces sp. San01]
MRLIAAEIGFFEDYEDEEALEVGVAGVDEFGVPRLFSFQRSTYEPDGQEIRSGMDSYNISTGRGFTVYGCLRSVMLADSQFTLEFAAEGAEFLEVSTPVEVDLRESGVDYVILSEKLLQILDWGAREKRPELIGLSIPGLRSGERLPRE